MNRLLFFLHLPKTAGTTLNALLEANFPQGSVLSVYDKAAQKRMDALSPKELQGLRCIQGHVFVRDFEQFFARGMCTFTMLREPVARVVSEYEFLRSWPENHLYDYLNSNNVSLLDYMAGGSPELKWRGRNLMCGSLAGSVTPCRDGEEMLARAKANLDRFDVVGLTERFDESLLLLQEAAGLENILYEPHNVRAPDGSRPRQPEDLSPQELEAVREHNRLDIALYEHARARVQREIESRGPRFRLLLAHFREVNRRYQAISEKILRRDSVVQDAKGWRRG